MSDRGKADKCLEAVDLVDRLSEILYDVGIGWDAPGPLQIHLHRVAHAAEAQLAEDVRISALAKKKQTEAQVQEAGK
jgi:hypothetical protein